MPEHPFNRFCRAYNVNYERMEFHEFMRSWENIQGRQATWGDLEELWMAFLAQLDHRDERDTQADAIAPSIQ